MRLCCRIDSEAFKLWLFTLLGMRGNAESQDLRAFCICRLAYYRAGFPASTAIKVRSGTGGKDPEIPQIEVAKIVPLDRMTVGCNSSVLGYLRRILGKARCA